MIVATFLVSAALVAGERLISSAQGTNVDPAGDKIEVTSRCFRRTGEPMVGVGESAVLYRNKDGFMAWPNETDATAQIRLVSQDGQTVQAYCNNEPMGTPQDLKPLVEAARKTRFNGVGIGILSGTASP